MRKLPLVLAAPWSPAAPPALPRKRPPGPAPRPPSPAEPNARPKSLRHARKAPSLLITVGRGAAKHLDQVCNKDPPRPGFAGRAWLPEQRKIECPPKAALRYGLDADRPDESRPGRGPQTLNADHRPGDRGRGCLQEDEAPEPEPAPCSTPWLLRCSSENHKETPRSEALPARCSPRARPSFRSIRRLVDAGPQPGGQSESEQRPSPAGWRSRRLAEAAAANAERPRSGPVVQQPRASLAMPARRDRGGQGRGFRRGGELGPTGFPFRRGLPFQHWGALGAWRVYRGPYAAAESSYAQGAGPIRREQVRPSWRNRPWAARAGPEAAPHGGRAPSTKQVAWRCKPAAGGEDAPR